MSIYEQSTKENNIKLQETIKYLQSKLKPVENPIIAKILPFLPYDVNKLILDKLDIEKKKYLLETEFNNLFRCFIHNTVRFYTADSESSPMEFPTNYIGLDSMYINTKTMKTSIKERYNNDDLQFDYLYNKIYIMIDRFMVNKIWNPSSDMDIVNCQKKINTKYKKINNFMDSVAKSLDGLRLINSDRNHHIIPIVKGWVEEDFKIFKSNSAINNKQYCRFTECIEEIIKEFEEDSHRVLES